MNKRNFRTYLMTLVISFWFQNYNAQEDYAILRKNFNVSAKGLCHDLCKTKDTLILKSDKKIDYIYAINSRSKRELDTYVSENVLRIPLNGFTKGRHVFVVEQDKMNIVFAVQINETLPKIAVLLDDRRIEVNN